MNCPSGDQAHAVMRAVTLCFTTDFCSGDHKPANKERVNEAVSFSH